MSPRRLAPVTALAVAGAAALTVGAHTPSPPRAAAPVDRAAVRAATAYVSHVLPAGMAPAWTPARVRRWATRRARRIPLPAGGTFDGIRWSAAGGPIALGEADIVLQHNARCQWLRAARDGREAATARAVLRVMASWPALASGGLEDVAACDRAADRERAYAAAHGLRPSR